MVSITKREMLKLLHFVIDNKSPQFQSRLNDLSVYTEPYLRVTKLKMNKVDG